MTRDALPIIGELFRCAEHDLIDVVSALGPYVLCCNDPPWSTLAPLLPPPTQVVQAWDMELAHLESLDAVPDHADVVVGLGGGTALDTAKFLAWKNDRRLVQIPTITSVDAGFTDAIGVRSEGKVRYIGTVVPELVVLDIPVIQSAPGHLNRAGIGDILSCHTGLFDWRLASDAGSGHAWDIELAALGRRLLADLDDAADDIAAVSTEGVRFMAQAYRHIGAACAAAGHSRFEEGSEHFWAYAYEHATGTHPIHGELIAMAVCAIAHVQGNDPQHAFDIVDRAGTRAHPADLGVERDAFLRCLTGLAEYSRPEGLDVGIADLDPISAPQAAAAWDFVDRLPRRSSN